MTDAIVPFGHDLNVAARGELRGEKMGLGDMGSRGPVRRTKINSKIRSENRACWKSADSMPGWVVTRQCILWLTGKISPS